jgi:hypothetical protein
MHHDPCFQVVMVSLFLQDLHFEIAQDADDSQIIPGIKKAV